MGGKQAKGGPQDANDLIGENGSRGGKYRNRGMGKVTIRMSRKATRNHAVN